MKTETFLFQGFNNTELHGILWLPEGAPKAVLQITHGMTEHIRRYDDLAEKLCGQGIAVTGIDLRGHGKNGGNDEIASFGERGWEASLMDMRLLFLWLAERFPQIPHFMLGFSLGSFLLREYMSRYAEGVDGAIILGTGYQPAPVLSVMMAVVQSQIKKAGFDNTTDLVKKLSFGTYNQKFRPNRTEADWLCGDNGALDAYLNDPLCRTHISAGLFWQMLGAMKRTCSKGAYDEWDKSIPVLLLSGAEDSVGNFGKGITAVHTQMLKAGLSHVTMHILPHARHDVLHEFSCGAAMQAQDIIIAWLNREATR